MHTIFNTELKIAQSSCSAGQIGCYSTAVWLASVRLFRLSHWAGFGLISSYYRGTATTGDGQTLSATQKIQKCETAIFSIVFILFFVAFVGNR